MALAKPRQFALLVCAGLACACESGIGPAQEVTIPARPPRPGVPARPDRALPRASTHRTGTATQRLQLLQDLIAQTIERRAWPGDQADEIQRFRERAQALRAAFTEARSETDLFRALVQLSCMRDDHHLAVWVVTKGLRPALRVRQAPVQFRAERRGRSLELFVAALAEDIDQVSKRVPNLGDRVVSVGGRTVTEWLEAKRPFVAASTPWHRSHRLAEEASMWRELFAQDPMGAPLALRLQADDGGTYAVRLPYRIPAHNRWTATPPADYPGFETALTSDTFRVHTSTTGRTVLILEWLGFDAGYRDHLDQLMGWAGKRRLLDHDVILDVSRSHGGKSCIPLLRHLAQKPFRPTRRTLRLSDLVPRIARHRRETYGSDDTLGRWLRDRAIPLAEQTPGAYAMLPSDHGDLVEPEENRFRGRLVCLMGPAAGSQVDQLAAMVVDNELGHTIGMPTAGFSNGLEWTETVRLADGTRLARFMWTVGHTLRPDGSVLEGNPAEPAESLVMTRQNFQHYRAAATERALRFLDTNE